MLLSEKTLIWRGQKEIGNNNNFFRCVCLILTRMSMNVHEFPNLSKMRLSQMNNDKFIWSLSWRSIFRESKWAELSTESIDNRLYDEEVQNSAYASRGTKAKQKTLSSKV